MTTTLDVARTTGAAGSQSHSAPLPLDTRIARAFDGADSSEIAVTLEQVTATIVIATTEAEQARQRALDPLVTAGELAAARTAMDDARFLHERLTAAVSRLRQRLAAARVAEEEARRLAHYRDLGQVRDQLAAELRTLYPAFALKLAALLTRIAANDRAIATLIVTRSQMGRRRCCRPNLWRASWPASLIAGSPLRGCWKKSDCRRSPLRRTSVTCGRRNVSEGDDPCLHLQPSSGVLPLTTIPSCATVRSCVSRCCCAMDLLLTQQED